MAGKSLLCGINKGHIIVWQIKMEIGSYLAVLRMFGTSLEQAI